MVIHLSNNLKELRRGKKISQEGLAEELEVTRNKIASYESRGIEPNLSLLVKISNFFEVSVDDLVATELNRNNIKEVRRAYRASKSLSHKTPEEYMISSHYTELEHAEEER